MKKPQLIFEPITEDQARLIDALINDQMDLSIDEIGSMIADLTGLPCVDSMSKQEASFIIDRLKGNQEWEHPRSARTKEAIGKDCSSLPYFNQVFFIRKSVQSLGWPVDRFSEWLFKITKVRSIKSLDRDQTKAAYVAMIHVLKARN